jgi:hypothetical protein
MLLDAEGGKKRADQIVEGDRLWSRPEGDPDGPLALKLVLERFVRVAPILNVQVAGQVLRTTREHPFYVEGKGWLPAGALEVGDLLRTRGGQFVAVEGIADSGEVTTVYNWRIADYHTYYVSATPEGASVWAHNAWYTNQQEFERAYRRENPDATDREVRRAWQRNLIEIDSRRQDRVDFEDPDPQNAAVQGRYTGDAHFYGDLPIQDHHAIPWENSEYNHQQHPLVVQAGADLQTDPRNIAPVINHQGPHSASYHRDVQTRLDTAFGALKTRSQAAADKALGEVMRGIWRDIGNGSLQLYDDRAVSLP